MHLLVTNSDLMTALQRVITFKILKYLPEYMNMDKSFFSPREHKCDNYVLLTLKCMQQIRKTNKVLHVSASNHILSDLHLAGVNAKKLLTDTLSQNTSSDCQSQNRHSTKIWSMSWNISRVCENHQRLTIYWLRNLKGRKDLVWGCWLPYWRTTFQESS